MPSPHVPARHLFFVSPKEKEIFLSFYAPHWDFIFSVKFFSMIPHNSVPSLNLDGSYMHRPYTVDLIFFPCVHLPEQAERLSSQRGPCTESASQQIQLVFVSPVFSTLLEARQVLERLLSSPISKMKFIFIGTKSEIWEWSEIRERRMGRPYKCFYIS